MIIMVMAGLQANSIPEIYEKVQRSVVGVLISFDNTCLSFYRIRARGEEWRSTSTSSGLINYLNDGVSFSNGLQHNQN